MQPALLVLLPGALTIVLAVLGAAGGQTLVVRLASATVAGGLSTLGLLTLVEQLVRERGKRREPHLWASWGGAPATRMLRHRENELSTPTKRAHYHRRLQRLVRDVHLPTESDEQKDPQAADQIYERCVEFLKTRTRDRVRFRLIFEENVNYGFCRNLWAMWPAGFAVTALATGISLFLTQRAVERSDGIWLFGSLVVLANAVFLAWWSFRINRALVLVPARAWAERLFESLDEL